MFRFFSRVQSITLHGNFRSIAQKSSQSITKEKWDLYAGVLVERLPVITKTLNPTEKEFQELLWQLEFESSLKSNHELNHERNLIQEELVKKGKLQIDLDESVSKQTAQDLKDQYIEEYKKFKLADRVTKADSTSDVKSTNRKLEQLLYLLVEQKLGDQKHLILPQGKRQDGETMRQTAERVLKEKCGDTIKVQFYGNAPCGFHKYKYPKNLRKEKVGAKIFFYRTSLKNGNCDPKVTDKFEWHNINSLRKLLKGSYLDSTDKFLFEK